eukprot:CAMPEP_0203761770 /NCGR_PEP_ID=MMETSP0098-20131031/14791_1 /ASSEMBLY_ACC=CAM_ASM_000208 /TAXON_ID=96639 /ORGANISM=" , Strain NY0313808BC1" /LENGTH=689 /DNA_ID=CAMNT_0050655903 /DNA_START=1 /DNA_END=2070 /DNA_ORIENTATION=+
MSGVINLCSDSEDEGRRQNPEPAAKISNLGGENGDSGGTAGWPRFWQEDGLCVDRAFHRMVNIVIGKDASKFLNTWDLWWRRKWGLSKDSSQFLVLNETLDAATFGMVYSAVGTFLSEFTSTQPMFKDSFCGYSTMIYVSGARRYLFETLRGGVYNTNGAVYGLIKQAAQHFLDPTVSVFVNQTQQRMARFAAVFVFRDFLLADMISGRNLAFKTTVRIALPLFNCLYYCLADLTMALEQGNPSADQMSFFQRIAEIFLLLLDCSQMPTPARKFSFDDEYVIKDAFISAFTGPGPDNLPKERVLVMFLNRSSKIALIQKDKFVLRPDQCFALNRCRNYAFFVTLALCEFCVKHNMFVARPGTQLHKLGSRLGQIIRSVSHIYTDIPEPELLVLGGSRPSVLGTSRDSPSNSAQKGQSCPPQGFRRTASSSSAFSEIMSSPVQPHVQQTGMGTQVTFSGGDKHGTAMTEPTANVATVQVPACPASTDLKRKGGTLEQDNTKRLARDAISGAIVRTDSTRGKLGFAKVPTPSQEGETQKETINLMKLEPPTSEPNLPQQRKNVEEIVPPSNTTPPVVARSLQKQQVAPVLSKTTVVMKHSTTSRNAPPPAMTSKPVMSPGVSSSKQQPVSVHSKTQAKEATKGPAEITAIKPKLTENEKRLFDAQRVQLLALIKRQRAYLVVLRDSMLLDL